MLPWRAGMALVVLGMLAAAVAAQNDTTAYLTKEGKLAYTLEVFVAQGGAAGFTGDSWIVEPDGKWKSGSYFNKPPEKPEKQGQLSKEQLAALVKELARYDLARLPKEEGRPMVNPFIANIKFAGPTRLNLPAGAELPKLDPKKANPSVAERYAGIVEALKKACREADKK